MQLNRLTWPSMLGSDYEGQICSIAGALEVVGERWSLLIVRNVFLGLRRGSMAEHEAIVLPACQEG